LPSAPSLPPSLTHLILGPHIVGEVRSIERLLVDVGLVHLQELHCVLEEALVGRGGQSLREGRREGEGEWVRGREGEREEGREEGRGGGGGGESGREGGRESVP